MKVKFTFVVEADSLAAHDLRGVARNVADLLVRQDRDDPQVYSFTQERVHDPVRDFLPKSSAHEATP